MPDSDVDCEILWVKLNIASCKSLYLASYCRPNANEEESLKQLDDSLSKLPRNNNHIWIAGYMNLPGISWPSGSIKTNCPTPAQHELFMEILADHGLTQVIDKPTREENMLDLMAVNNPTLLNRTEIIPGISDDNVVFAELDIAPLRQRQTKRKIPIYGKAKWEEIDEEMKKTHELLTAQNAESDVETMWETFKTSLQSAISQFIPHRTASSQDRPPWITRKIKKLLNARNHLHKKIQRNNTSTRKEKMKSLKKTIHKATKEAHWSYTENLLTESENNSHNKKLWNFIKHRKTNSVDIAPLKENGVLKDSPKEKAEILNAQFSSVFTKDSPTDFSDHTQWRNNKQYPNTDDIEISTEGIEKLLCDLNQHKSMGPDNLHPKVLKHLASTIAPSLQLIFQKSIATGRVPSDWKQANVSPIFKKGERYNPANYRPVSLTCICSKILEHIITKHLRLQASTLRTARLPGATTACHRAATYISNGCPNTGLDLNAWSNVDKILS